MHKLYTIGYGGLREPADLVRLAHGLKAAVIDIRFLPVSRRACWGLMDLRRTLVEAGIAYASVRELGNVNFREPSLPIQLKAPEPGMRLLMHALRHGNQILLCGCKEFRGCHRVTVGELAAREGVEVIHYMPEVESVAAPQMDLF